MPTTSFSPAGPHAVAASPLTLQVVTDYQQLGPLEQPWNACLTAIPDTPPFCTHAWITSWWSCFGQGGGLHLIIGWRGDRIVGVAPFMADKTTWYGIPARRLRCLYNPHVQRLAFPVLAKDKAAFHDALWQHLHARKAEWDVLELNQFNRDSYTLHTFEALARHAGLSVGRWHQGASPYLKLSGQWQDYVAAMSANRRGTLRRKLRRLADEGEVRLEQPRAGETLDEALADAFRLEALGWKGTRQTAILSQPEVLRFYRDLARRLAPHSGLALFFLTVDGKRIAFQYCLEADACIYLLKLGYDPSYSRYSPSELLTWLVLESAFEAGKREYDFLGDSDEWKLKWATTCRDHDWLYIFSDSLRAKLLYNLKVQLVPKVKALADAA